MEFGDNIKTKLSGGKLAGKEQIERGSIQRGDDTMAPADIVQLVTALFGFGAMAAPKIIKWLGGKTTKSASTILMSIGIVLLVGNLAVLAWRYWGERFFPKPQVTINANVEDEIGGAIAKDSAPYIVYVRGTVANAEGLYVYLVVDDGNAKWVQPGPAHIAQQQFAEKVALGEPTGVGSLNKRYRVFAVVVNREYGNGQKLDSNTVKATSNVVELIRTR